MAGAVKRMGEIDPGARFKAFLMIKEIYDQYRTIIKEGPKAFETTEGKGDNAITYTDHKRYVDVSAKIAEEIPGLLKKLEEGFGIADVKGDLDEVDGDSSDMRDFYTEKDN